MENGYHLWDFKGTSLREEPLERFAQFLWRPRPPTLLSKEEQKTVRKNLREYSKGFEEEDLLEADAANAEVVETRKRQLQEWRAWRSEVEEDLVEERLEYGLPADPSEVFAPKAEEGEEQIIEEIVEEIISEDVEVIG
jgi:translation initiation factor 3 subunit B